jgi:hypothetical protein
MAQSIEAVGACVLAEVTAVKVARLEASNSRLEASVAELKASNADLKALVDRLEALVVALAARTSLPVLRDPVSELHDAGYSAVQLKAAGLSAAELSAAELNAGSFSFTEVSAASGAKGRVIAAAKAGDLPALILALKEGGSTDEKDDVSVDTPGHSIICTHHTHRGRNTGRCNTPPPHRNPHDCRKAIRPYTGQLGWGTLK